MKRPNLNGRAQVAKSLGQYPEAERLALEALSQDPGDLEARYTLGRAQWHLYDNAAAEATARKLLEQDPEDPWHYNLLGDVLRSHGSAPRGARRALPHYRIAHRLAPTSPVMAYDLADALHDLGELKEAAEVLDAALRDSAEDIDLLILRSKVARNREDRLLAARCSRRALALGPEKADAHDGRAAAAFDLGRYRVAERHYREARRIDPSVVGFYRTQMVREARYMQSPWYLSTLVAAGLVFVWSWPWKAFTIGVAGALVWWLWPVSGYLLVVNAVAFVAVRGVLRLLDVRAEAARRLRLSPERSAGRGCTS